MPAGIHPGRRALGRSAKTRELALAIKLAGTAERRLADAGEIQRLAGEADYDRLADLLADARLMPLLGTRLAEHAPGAAPQRFLAALDAAVVHARRRAALTSQMTLQLAVELEAAGIAVVALKGPLLAERLYGDPGLRISNDIDLLVAREDFTKAVAALGQSGYETDGDRPWAGELPLFEASLQADEEWKPPIDLHWRLHWYEEAFSRDYLTRSGRGTGGMRVPSPVDELAALLIFWCRDGLAGLRHAVDVAAWWDRHGAEAAPGALDELAKAHPPLRGCLAAAALLAERATGVPPGRLLSQPAAQRRVRLAMRVADVGERRSRLERDTAVVLVDALVAQRRSEVLPWHVIPSPEAIDHMYGLAPEARVRRAALRAWRIIKVSARLARGAAQLARHGSARARGGRL